MQENQQVTINGKPFTVSPLSLKQLKALGPTIAKLDGMKKGIPTAEQIDGIVEIVHASLSRTHEGLTHEQVADMVDLGNMVDLIERVMGVSGLKAKQSGEA